MTRPDDKPTDARLFPLEANATADLDAKALDEVAAWLSSKKNHAIPEPLDDAYQLFFWGEDLAPIVKAVRSTGREV